MVMKKYKSTFVVCIIFPLDSTDPGRYLHILAQKMTVLYTEILKKKQVANIHV